MTNVRVAASVVLLTAGCSREMTPPPHASTQVSRIEAVRVPEDLAGVEITLERTECFGRCPSYVVVIDGDGRVKYTGRSHVREKGERENAISEDDVRTLLERFVRADFFSIDESYETQAVTDGSTTYLTVKINGRTKRLQNSFAQGADDFPPELFEEWKTHTILSMLAHSIDSAVHIERWIGSDEERQHLKEPPGFPSGSEPPK